MIRLPRFLPAVVLACATAMPVAPIAWAQDAAKPAEPAPTAADPKPAVPAPAVPGGAAVPAPDAKPGDAAAAPAAPAAPAKEDPLSKTVDDFWHYGKIARYDLAADAGKRILASGAPPETILDLFKTVTADRHDDLNSWLIKWQQIDAMKEVSTNLMATLNQGQDKRRLDIDFIHKQIERLAVNERGYINGLQNLRQAGEVAVPVMLEYLRDNSKKEFQSAVRRALVDLGRAALNPLLACTEIKQDQDTLISIISILGQIGYNDEVPYLARLASGKETPPAVKTAAAHALERMGTGNVANLDVATLFYDLSEKFYYGNAAISYDLKNPVAYIWFWDDNKGLYKEEVPPTIFNDIMSMRTAEYSLKADAAKTPAISLWLSADYKREVDLGETAQDPVNRGKPSAHFYGTSAGVQHLNLVLERARKDRNAAVSLKAIKSLAATAGQANLYNGDVQPLVDAMNYPDRLVRFEAALAAGGALPEKKFNGQEQVVSILAEAIAQTGKSSALLLSANQDAFNKFAEQLKAAGYTTGGGITPEAAVNSLSSMPSVDVIVIDATSGVDDTTARKMIDMAGLNGRLSQLARVIITTTPRGNAFAPMSVGNPLINVTTAKEGAALAPALQKARERSGSLPIDEKTAQSYALRSADLLGKIAISHGQVLNLLDAQPTLLGSLEDARPEIAKAGATVLGYLNSKEPQPALLTKSLDEKAADELKVATLKALSNNERFFGNHLSAEQVDSLKKLTESAATPDVKNAASEALGSLNLPSNEAKSLIVNQSRVN
jgi:hypothetical protein